MSDINPNSRASFTDSFGRLTKYGAEVIRDLYTTLGLVGGTSILDDIQQENDTGAARTRGLIKRIKDLEENTSSPATRFKSLEKRIEALEQGETVNAKVKSILKRLDDIESQL